MNLIFITLIFGLNLFAGINVYVPSLSDLYEDKCPKKAFVKIKTPDRSSWSKKDKIVYIRFVAETLSWDRLCDANIEITNNGFSIKQSYNHFIFNSNADLIKAQIDEDMFIPTYYSCLKLKGDRS